MKRRSDLDTVNGILIVYMIIVHILGTSHTEQTQWHLLLRPLNFFMAWFFFKSGMFHNALVNSKQMLMGGGKKLLLVYVAFSIVALLLYWLEQVVAGEHVLKYLISPAYQVLALGAVTTNLPLWFLVSLFAVKMISAAIVKSKQAILTTMILSLSIAFGLDLIGFFYTVWPGNIALGLFFYCCGYMLKTKQYERQVVIFAIAVFIVLHLTDYSNLDFRANHCTYGHYLSYVAISLSGCIVMNNIFRKCGQNVFTSIGKDSMSYYIFHYPILVVVGIAFNIAGIESHNYVGLMTRVCACIVLLPLTNRLYKQYFIPFQERILK